MITPRFSDIERGFYMAKLSYEGRLNIYNERKKGNIFFNVAKGELIV